MEKTNEVKLFNKRNVFLIGGVITLLISLCIIFPYESGQSNFIADLVYTFFTLAIALFLILYGLMGKSFFKGVLFLLGSTIFGFIFLFIAYFNNIFNAIAAIYVGIPIGIITGLVFLLANFQFLRDKTSYKLLKQIGLYLLILVIVSTLFTQGGDWIFEISEYFHPRN